jgi:site-specific DNA recombinase
MTKCAIYCRVSTHGQDISGQLENLPKFAEKKGWEIYRIYIDDGISGSTIDARPDFKDLLEDIVNQNFNILLAEEHDRITRDEDLAVRGFIQQTLKANNILLWSPTEGSCDLSTFTGEVVSTIKLMMAAEERKAIKRRTQRGQMQKWKDGSRFIGKPPYGYRAILNSGGKRTGKSEIYDPEAKIVQKIFSLYNHENYSMDDIALILNKDAVPTPSASAEYKRKSHLWSITAVRRILINQAYTGVDYHNKNKPKGEWIKKEFPVIVSQDHFDHAQNKRQYNKQKSKKKHYELEDSWMAYQVLYCGECGRKIAKKPKPRKSGGFYRMYACKCKILTKKQLRNLGRERCIMKSVPADKIDERIFFQIAFVLSSPNSFAEQWFKDVDKIELKTRYENLSKQVVAKEKVIKKAYRELSIITNRHFREEFIKGVDKDADDLDSLKKRRRKAEREYNSYQNKTDRLAKFKKALESSDYWSKGDIITQAKNKFLQFLYSLPFKEKKRIVEAVVSPENGGKCRLRYQTPSDYIDEHEFADFSKEELSEPQTDRQPVIDMDFEMDLDKIETLITNLNKKKFLVNYGQSHGKRTFDRFNTTVQREFTQDKVFGYDLLRYDPGCSEYP